MINIEKFISENVIMREKSMFLKDINDNYDFIRNSVENKSVLVIGGAGTIGSSYIKAILPFKPSKLFVVDINENGLAELTRDLRSTNDMFVPEEYITYAMDYSSDVFKKMFLYNKGFDIVANFSAHKHVRSEKDIFSVEALLRNNIINAKKLLDLLTLYPPENYFCVSTDKAANPVNIMGASKRIMEDIIFSYSDIFSVKTARFANVAFSNGSLPAGFIERMKKLQPLSAPLDVTRYFVSPEESGQICMLSCILGSNREIFFPKLEESQMMSFDIIAERLLKCNGYNVCRCSSEKEAILKSAELKSNSDNYPVYFSLSDTSGEKAYEEFYTESESVDLNRFSSLGVVVEKPIIEKEKIDTFIDELCIELDKVNVSKSTIVSIIKKYLPNFNHIETGKSLDSKM